MPASRIMLHPTVTSHAAPWTTDPGTAARESHSTAPVRLADLAFYDVDSRDLVCVGTPRRCLMPR